MCVLVRKGGEGGTPVGNCWKHALPSRGYGDLKKREIEISQILAITPVISTREIVGRMLRNGHSTRHMPGGAQPDYIQIATPLVVRGFRVTPVHPETKSGVMRNWQNHQATTSEEVLRHAKYYPHHNVGVVGKRGVGRHIFLDIDADGVVE